MCVVKHICRITSLYVQHFIFLSGCAVVQQKVPVPYSKTVAALTPLVSQSGPLDVLPVLVGVFSR